MSEHGAALQTYNQELVKCIEDLKERRIEVNTIINKQEVEKATLESHIKALQEKLAILNKSLGVNKTLKESYDRTIKDTEAGFKKILEGSQTLLNLVQNEVSRIDQTKNITVNH